MKITRAKKCGWHALYVYSQTLTMYRGRPGGLSLLGNNVPEERMVFSLGFDPYASTGYQKPTIFFSINNGVTHRIRLPRLQWITLHNHRNTWLWNPLCALYRLQNRVLYALDGRH